MNNVLFIGGAGFIGSSLIKRLLRDGNSSIYVLEPPYANVSRLEGLNIEIFRETLDDTEKIEKIILCHNIDCIVHLVSTLIPGSGYEDFIYEVQKVVFPTMRLSQLCSKHGIKLVFFSSGGTVYGNREEPIPFVEDDERRPISYYGLTKMMLENNILFEHRTQGLQYLIIRPSNPYGYGQSLSGGQGFIAIALGKVLKGESITVWGDGTSIRDYIFIDDLSNIVIELMEAEVQNTILNVGSGMGYSVNEILVMIKKCTNRDIPVIYTPARSQDVSAMVLSTQKLKKNIDLEITPLEVGIKSFYNILKNNIDSL